MQQEPLEGTMAEKIDKEALDTGKRVARKSRAKKTETKRTVYKTPGTSASNREMLLGTTAVCTLLVPSSYLDLGVILESTGRRLGVIGDRYDPATRTRRPYIVRP